MHIEKFDGKDLKVPVKILVRTGHYKLDEKPNDPPRQVVVATFTSVDDQDQFVEDTFIINTGIGKHLASVILEGVQDVEAQAN